MLRYIISIVGQSRVDKSGGSWSNLIIQPSRVYTARPPQKRKRKRKRKKNHWVESYTKININHHELSESARLRRSCLPSSSLLQHKSLTRATAIPTTSHSIPRTTRPSSDKKSGVSTTLYRKLFNHSIIYLTNSWRRGGNTMNYSYPTLTGPTRLLVLQLTNN